MSAQPSLFDVPAPARRRAAGQASAVDRCPPAVLDAIHDAIDYYVAHDLPFTSESVRGRLSSAVLAVLDAKQDGKAKHGGVMGGVMERKQDAGAIEHVGWQAAQRDAARGRPLRVWRRRRNVAVLMSPRAVLDELWRENAGETRP